MISRKAGSRIQTAGSPSPYRTGQSRCRTRLVQLRTVKRHTTKRVPSRAAPRALPTAFQFIHHRPRCPCVLSTGEMFAPSRMGRPRLPPNKLPMDTLSHHHRQLSSAIWHPTALLHRIVTRRRPCTTLQHPSQPPPVPSHRHPFPVLNNVTPSTFPNLRLPVDPRTASMVLTQPVASHQLALLACVGRR